MEYGNVKMKKPIMKDFIYQSFIDENVCEAILKYWEEHPHRVVDGECGGGVVKDIKDSQDLVIHRNSEEYPFNLYKKEIQKCLDQYLSIYPEIVRLLAPFSLQENYMIQRYEPNAGYKLLHCERSMPMCSNRVFVFMTYLNTVKNAGTEFPFQNQITECDMGRTVIWPGEWTHPHKGVINKDEVKYIITGWLGFDPQ